MRIAIVSIAVAAAGLSLLASGQQTEQPAGVRMFMRGKLNHSQRVLEGLVSEDFESILQHAERLKLLSHEATWQVIQTAEYRQQSEEFRRAADELMTAAKSRNIDGVALAYVGLTLNCVRCHKYVRAVQSKRPLAPGRPQ
jgi:hypothetical protein